MSTPLRKAREEIGKTQVQVARASRIGQNSYSRIERGRGTPSARVAERIVRAFHRFGATHLNELHVLYPKRFARGAA